jgi:hypothetical protein
MAGWGSPRRKGTDRQSCRSGPEHRSELSPIPRLALCDSRAGGKVRVPPDSGSDGGDTVSVRPSSVGCWSHQARSARGDVARGDREVQTFAPRPRVPRPWRLVCSSFAERGEFVSERPCAADHSR